MSVFIARLMFHALTLAMTLTPVAAVVPWFLPHYRSITATFYKRFPVTSVITAAVAITVSSSSVKLTGAGRQDNTATLSRKTLPVIVHSQRPIHAALSAVERLR